MKCSMCGQYGEKGHKFKKHGWLCQDCIDNCERETGDLIWEGEDERDRINH